MKCPACGADNEDGALFCDRCKADLDMPAAPPPTPQAPMTDDQPTDETAVPLELSELLPDGTTPILLEPVEPAAAPVALETISPAAPPPLPGAATVTAEAVAGPVVDLPLPSLKPRLVVLRGMKIDMQYPVYPGKNYLGRTDDKPVDIDLDDQEAPDRIWCSRQHAVITFENGQLTVEDLNSLNGSFVNRARVYPGQAKELRDQDVIQIGTVHLKLLLG